MARIQANSGVDYESIMVRLTKKKYPIAFNAKVEELMESGAFDDRQKAEEWVENTPIELELYYDKHSGLFGVEAEAIEYGATDICSPYTGEYMLDYVEE